MVDGAVDEGEWVERAEIERAPSEAEEGLSRYEDPCIYDCVCGLWAAAGEELAFSRPSNEELSPGAWSWSWSFLSTINDYISYYSSISAMIDLVIVRLIDWFSVNNITARVASA